jgi:hypothetical protein
MFESEEFMLENSVLCDWIQMIGVSDVYGQWDPVWRSREASALRGLMMRSHVIAYYELVVYEVHSFDCKYFIILLLLYRRWYSRRPKRRRKRLAKPGIADIMKRKEQ